MYFRGLFAFNASVPQAHTLYSHKTDKLDNKEDKWARLDRQTAGQRGNWKGRNWWKAPRTQRPQLLLLLVHPISWRPAVKTTCAGWQVQQTKRMKRDHNREESLKPGQIGIERSAI